MFVNLINEKCEQKFAVVEFEKTNNIQVFFLLKFLKLIIHCHLNPIENCRFLPGMLSITSTLLSTVSEVSGPLVINLSLVH